MPSAMRQFLAVASAAAMLGSAGAMRADTVMQTRTTRYTYNGDGAPVAVSTQIGTQPAATTYLTWANFQNGTARSSNANLLGYGPTSDGSQLDAQFTYDARNRLIGVSSAGQSVDYTYHPASVLASSTLASSQDTLQFYYGNGTTPQVSNTYQPATAHWASFLGPVRYVSDGTEQTLLAPRKDTAGVFDAGGQTLTPYQYDAYGARSDAAAACGGSSKYDLAENPFQYAGEYRDPTWCGVYLRARWYAPGLHTFLQRDPADPVQRFGYVGGNPIMHTDPTGLSWRGGYGSAARGYNRFMASPWGTALSVLPYFGEATFLGQFVFNAGSFFHEPRQAEMFGFSLAAGLLGGIRDFGAGNVLDRRFGSRRGFAGRILGDFAIGAGMSAFAATTGKHHRFDTTVFFENLAATAAGIGVARGVGRIGYHPFSMTAEDIERQALRSDEALVFEVRQRRKHLPFGPRRGVYVVTDTEVHYTDLRTGGQDGDEKMDFFRDVVETNPTKKSGLLLDLAYEQDEQLKYGTTVEAKLIGRVPKGRALGTFEALHSLRGTLLSESTVNTRRFGRVEPSDGMRTSAGYAKSIINSLGLPVKNVN